MSAVSFTPAPSSYDQGNEQSFRERIRRAIETAFVRGQDIEVGAGRLILTDDVTGTRYKITMHSGTLTETAL